MADSTLGFDGQIPLPAGIGALNAQAQLIRRILGDVHIATLVRVISCTNSGAVSAVGTVDVQPIVGQLDGAGNLVQHGPLHALPYLRIQGGSNAVIIDPQPGDIGIAIFADRDISQAKASQAMSAPGSLRKFDMADGLYLGGVLNGVPSQYVQFSASGLTLVSPTAITMQTPTIALNASGGVTVQSATFGVTASGAATISAASMEHNGTNIGATHVHSGVQSGSSNTGTPH